MAFNKKILIIAVITIALIASGFWGIKEQKTNALQRKTIEEFIQPVGTFIKENPDFLSQSIKSLKTKEIDPEKVIARVNGWPITIGELEFRKKMRECSGLGSPEASDIFNVLIEEKVVLDFALKNDILPTSEQVKSFIEREKKWYEDSNGQYKEQVDAFLKASNMTIDEYWSTYEWYNAFRLQLFDNCYKFVVKEGQKAGKLPEVENGVTPEIEKQFKNYWQNKKKELKAKASVRILDSKGLNLK